MNCLKIKIVSVNSDGSKLTDAVDLFEKINGTTLMDNGNSGCLNDWKWSYKQLFRIYCQQENCVTQCSKAQKGIQALAPHLETYLYCYQKKKRW